MELESWLDGYDTRKNDLLAWFGEGGDAVAGARELLGELEQALKNVRHRIQADAAAADLARLDDLLGGAEMVGDAGPERTIVESGSVPTAAPAPAAQAPKPEAEPWAQAAEPVPAAVPTMPDIFAAAASPAPAAQVPEPAAAQVPEPMAAPVPEPVAAQAPEEEPPAKAAEGILKSLAWMDSRAPDAPAPASRSRTASRPAVLDMFGIASAPEAAAAAAPAPAPAAPVEPVQPVQPVQPVRHVEPPAAAPVAEVAAVDPLAALSDPLAALADPIFPASPAETPRTDEPLFSQDAAPAAAFEPSPAPATVFADPEPAPTQAPVFEPVRSAEPAPAAATAVAPPPPPPAPPAPAAAPAAPARKRKPIVIDCPEGEQRRAALGDVGPGPDVPYLLHAVIEIPRGGGTGYVYDDVRDVFVVVDHPTAEVSPALSHVASGCIPDTVSDDGAHLDAFVLSSGAAGPGELLRVRPLGYLRRADGDHKLICVPEKHPAQALAQIPETVLRDCETWKNPTGVTGGTWCDGQKARELIRRCCS